MAEVEIVIKSINRAGAGLASVRSAIAEAGKEASASSARVDALSRQFDRASLSAQRAGVAAAEAAARSSAAQNAAAAAADRLAKAEAAAVDAAVRLGRGEMSAADAAKVFAKESAAAVKATEAQASASLRAERAEIAQKDAALKNAEAQRLAAKATGEQASASRRAELAEIAQRDAALKAAEAQRLMAEKAKAAAEQTSGLGSAAHKAASGGLLALKLAGEQAFREVGHAAVYSVEKAAKFEQSITMLNTQAGVTKDKLKGLSDGVLQLAGQVGFSPESLSEALFHVESNFASMGITSEKALELTKVAAEGAAVGHANLVDVTNALTAAVASGIPGVENFDQAMGKLNATVGSGDMKMQDLANAFGGGMVAVVKGYGLSISDVGAALATFGDNNIRGAKAGTYLRMAVEALAVPAKGGAKALKLLGLESDTLAKDMQKGGLKLALQDVVDRMHKAGIGAKEQGQIITELFGKKAGAGVAVLIGQFDRLTSKYPEINKQGADFGKSWEETQKTTAQGFEQLKNSLEALAIVFGRAMMPAVNAIGQAMTKALADPVVSKALEDFGKYLGIVLTQAAPLLPVIMKLASTFMTAMGPVLPIIAKALVQVADALGKALGKVILELAPHLPRLAKAFGDMAIAVIPLIPSLAKLLIAFIPLVPAIAAVAEMVAKFGALYVKVLAKVIDVLAAVIKPVAQVIGVIVKVIHDAFMWLWRNLWPILKDIGSSIASVWNSVSKTVSSVMGKIMGVFSAGWNLVKTVVMAVWNIIHAIIFGKMTDVHKAIHDGVDKIGKAWDAFWKKAKHLVTATWDAILAALDAAWTGIKKGASSALKWIGDALSSGWSAAKRITSDAWNGLYNAVLGAFKSVVKVVRNLPGDILNALGNIGMLLFEAGRNVIRGLINGILSMLGSVGNTMSSIMSKIAGYLPHSPAKEGPLSGDGSPERSGRTISQMLATGMASGTGAVAQAASKVAGAARSGMSAMGRPRRRRRRRHHAPPRLNINQQLDNLARGAGRMSLRSIDAVIEKLMAAHRLSVAQLSKATQILMGKGGHNVGSSQIDGLVREMKKHYKGLTSVDILKTAIKELEKHPNLSISQLMKRIAGDLKAEERKPRGSGRGSGSGRGGGSGEFISNVSWRAAGVQYTVGGVGRGRSGQAAGSSGGSTGVGQGQALTINFATMKIELDFAGGGSAIERAMVELMRHAIRVRGGNVQKVLGQR